MSGSDRHLMASGFAMVAAVASHTLFAWLFILIAIVALVQSERLRRVGR